MVKKIINKSNIFETYGLTEEIYQIKFKEQGGKCFICRFPPKVKRLAVDHRHIKGYTKLDKNKKVEQVRGLLCYTCNKGIGFLLEAKGNSRLNLKNVIEYFKLHKMKTDEK